MFYNKSRVNLSKWEEKMKEIKGIPIVPTYKYLGIELNKRLGYAS